MASLAWETVVSSTIVSYLVLATDWPAKVAPQLFTPASGPEIQNITYLEGFAIGLVVTIVVMLLRTMVRGVPVAKRVTALLGRAGIGSPPRP